MEETQRQSSPSTGAEPIDPDRIEALSIWFEERARDLPWRATRDPYSIWISEVMLQQTQVSTVLPYYTRFLKRYPDVSALACSEEAEVLGLWSGLGYYSRAKNLRRGAQYLCESHAGVFPESREEALQVPGVGPYTAGAILSIAYDLPVPIVDGNVKRVMARYYALELPIDTPAADRFFWKHAQQWVEVSRSPRVLNQAMMELGATVCTKANPQCGACPLQSGCAAFASERQNQFPLRRPRRETVELHWAVVVYENSGRIWLEKNPVGEWWSDLWDFPHYAVSDPRAVLPAIRARGGEALERALEPQVHRVTHHKLNAYPYLISIDEDPKSDAEGRWWNREELTLAPLSSLARKIVLSM